MRMHTHTYTHVHTHTHTHTRARARTTHTCVSAQRDWKMFSIRKRGSKKDVKGLWKHQFTHLLQRNHKCRQSPWAQRMLVVQPVSLTMASVAGVVMVLLLLPLPKQNSNWRVFLHTCWFTLAHCRVLHTLGSILTHYLVYPNIGGRFYIQRYI